jgi:polyhydroxybutyrate depolymerase
MHQNILGMKPLKLTVIIVLLVLVTALAIIICKRNTSQPTDQQTVYSASKKDVSIEVNGTNRQYISYTPTRVTKLLVILHGGGGSYTKIDKSTELSVHLSDSDETILLYPNAVDENWNDGRLNTDGTTLRTTKDSEFIDQLITMFQNKYNISTRNTTLGGISNGAIFSNYYGCQTSRVGNVFSVVGSFPISNPRIQTCANSSVNSIISINSIVDPLVKFDGGSVGFRDNRGETESVVITREIWKNSGKNILTYDLKTEGHIWPKSELDATAILLNELKSS